MNKPGESGRYAERDERTIQMVEIAIALRPQILDFANAYGYREQNTLALRSIIVAMSRILRMKEMLGLQNLQSMRVLDVACGTDQYHQHYAPEAAMEDEYLRGVFAPWFCRLAHSEGASVAGIDMHPSNPHQYDKWTFTQMDLRNPESLDQPIDDYFHIINCNQFIGDPNDESTDFALLQSFTSDDGQIAPNYFSLKTEIENRLLQKLTPGGIFALNKDYFTK